MYLKLTRHGRICKQNNQFLTKSHDELEDNSISRKKRNEESLKKNWVEGEDERIYEFGSLLNLSNQYFMLKLASGLVKDYILLNVIVGVW